jgi:hypothetical protein
MWEVSRVSVTVWKSRPKTVRAQCAKTRTPLRGIPSNAVQVKLCVNLSGPPGLGYLIDDERSKLR